MAIIYLSVATAGILLFNLIFAGIWRNNPFLAVLINDLIVLWPLVLIVYVVMVFDCECRPIEGRS